MSIITLERVTRRFGRVAALDAVDFSVDRPQVIGLVGRNGAGKSTLLRLLPPLMHPTSGTVRVFGLDPWQHQEAVRQRLGYVSDQERYPGGVRVRDLLDLCAGTYARWDAHLVESFRVRLGLARMAPFRGLSQGQQRQVSLLCAIGHRPELLLLDEPAANFDPAVRREFLAIVIDLLAETGSTVLMATHLLADLERLAERLVVIQDGTIIDDTALTDFTAGMCQAEIAELTPLQDAALQRSGRCLHRQHLGSTHQLILACSIEEAPRLVRTILGSDATVRALAALSLEDAFIHRTRKPSLATSSAAGVA